ncbi:hypothetical protein BD779DRAFT_1498157 [Infundibulicybe gibba]|nr:hypothetical protein BD779DRAFT_1498157 [Infundibulicybe gibba]
MMMLATYHTFLIVFMHVIADPGPDLRSISPCNITYSSLGPSQQLTWARPEAPFVAWAVVWSHIEILRLHERWYPPTISFTAYPFIMSNQRHLVTVDSLGGTRCLPLTQIERKCRIS